MTEEQNEPSQLVENVKQMPCGCIVTNYSDKRRSVSPCFPCGLAQIANTLTELGQVFGAMSTRARTEQQANIAAAAPGSNRLIDPRLNGGR